MTAKEQLRQTVDELTEAEAAETLNFLSRRRGEDALGELLAGAPLDDEPISDEARWRMQAMLAQRPSPSGPRPQQLTSPDLPR